MAHSKFSPSQLSRIIACPASVKVCDSVPDPGSSVYAEEGTLLHGYMDQLMHGEIVEHSITNHEHQYACRTALNYVQNIIDTRGKAAAWSTEIAVLVDDCPEVFGTADLVVYNRETGTLDVIDYKFGGSVFVEVENNTQFLAYAAGVMDVFKLHNIVHTVNMHVVQPRMDNMKMWSVSANYIHEWVDTVLKKAVLLSQADEPQFHPSQDACRWCRGKAVCPACHEAASINASVVFDAFKEVQSDNFIVSQERVLAFYNSIAELESQIKAVKDYILAEHLRGTKFPGLKLVRTNGRRAFADEGKVAKYLSERDIDIDDIYETKLRSPAQIEKVCKELKKDPDFQALIVKPEGNPTVVDASDARPDIRDTNPLASVAD